MLIRVFSFEELEGERLMEVYREANEENGEYFYPDCDPALAAKKASENFLRYLRVDFFPRPGACYWIWEEEDQWRSALRTCEISPRLFYLEALETHPGFRRQGYGEKLLRDVIRKLKSEGGFRLADCVRKGNRASLALHLACGFRIVQDPGYNYQSNVYGSGEFGMEYSWNPEKGEGPWSSYCGS